MSDGSAERVPEPKRDRAEEFSRDFWHRYEPLVEAARRADQMSKTDGWGLNYRNTKAEYRKKIVLCCKAIEETVKVITSEGTSESAEKGIKDTLKTLTEERERHEAWRALGVRPYASIADDGARVLNDLKRKARDVESGNPLLWGGLAFEVDQRIHDYWPSIEWDEDRGEVTVIEARN